MPVATYLDKIVAAHRLRASKDERDLYALLGQAEGTGGTRGFSDHIADHPGLAVIAEIKRRSPSKGDIDLGLTPSDVALEYETGGATCLSVLTDEEFFSGSSKDLESARASCSLPVLRKDFTVSVADICDARIMGSDAVLLIVSALDDSELGALHTLARELEMDALVEVHDEAELERALSIGAELIGVNQRDLHSFEVDPHRALDLAGSIPAAAVAVAESGITSREDAARLAAAGFQAILVGESLLRSKDRRSAVAELSRHTVGHRPAEHHPEHRPRQVGS